VGNEGVCVYVGRGRGGERALGMVVPVFGETVAEERVRWK
jgi:hypothetical protein